MDKLLSSLFGDLSEKVLQNTLIAGSSARVVRQRESRQQELCWRDETGPGRFDVNDQDIQSKTVHCVSSGNVKLHEVF